MKREKTVKVLEDFYSKKSNQLETKDIKENVSMKELNELKLSFFTKMDEMKKDYEKQSKESNEKIIQELKNIKYQMLNEMISIEDQDLEFNLPLKKRNCFHVKDVQKAKDLGGIATLKDLERVIDNSEYQDIIEVKNTLICLETVIDEWKNDKIKLVELDQEIQIKQDFSQWKQKDNSLLAQLILNKIENDQFLDLEIMKRIENDFNKLKRRKKDQVINDIYKDIIESILIEWKTKNVYDDEMNEFFKFISIDLSTNLQDLKSKFEWEMLPKWEERREKLKSILRILPPKVSNFDGMNLETK